jgi:hypothetical protein
MPGIGHHALAAGGGRVAARDVLFLGVVPLGQFRYEEVRAFGRRALAVLAGERPAARRVAMTIHGPGYGLDETEAFRAQMAGALEALDAGDYPPSLEGISVVELVPRRARRLQMVLQEIVPGGVVAGLGTDAARGGAAVPAAAGRSRRSPTPAPTRQRSPTSS